jgi:hypothetical protein
MTQHAKATFEVKSWNEEPYNDLGGGMKLTRAKVTKSFRGDVEGEGAVEYLMFYRSDGTADFIGFERVIGRLGDRKGGFVLQHSGTYEGGVAKTAWLVVSGSGTDGLQGLRGKGGSAIGHEKEHAFTLDYEIA